MPVMSAESVVLSICLVVVSLMLCAVTVVALLLLWFRLPRSDTENGLRIARELFETFSDGAEIRDELALRAQKKADFETAQRRNANLWNPKEPEDVPAEEAETIGVFGQQPVGGDEV